MRLGRFSSSFQPELNALKLSLASDQLVIKYKHRQTTTKLTVPDSLLL
jgi:hypothetical protein